ncbi:MAG: hypothetical protein AAGK74_19005, partial [Chloroflexota bacterium]
EFARRTRKKRKRKKHQAELEHQQTTPNIQRIVNNPSQMSHEDAMQLQRQYGNAFVQRLVQGQGKDAIQRDDTPVAEAEDARPSIDHLPPMTQILLAGAMEKDTITEAVRQIYDNMHNRTGWKYNASTININGEQYITGADDTGMCESYSEAFLVALRKYDELRANHPVDAVKNGDLEYHKDLSLVGARFATRRGLTLMGNTALRGNVYREVDGSGSVVNDDTDAINRFVFKGHWYAIVNDVAYDPIFYSIGEENVEHMLDANYKGTDNTAQYLPDTAKPIDSGEFGATFVMINDKDTFNANLDALVNFHGTRSAKIDAILDGGWGSRIGAGVFKGAVKPEKATLIEKLRNELAARHIDLTEFMEVVEIAYLTGKVTRDQRAAL